MHLGTYIYVHIGIAPIFGLIEGIVAWREAFLGAGQAQATARDQFPWHPGFASREVDGRGDAAVGIQEVARFNPP